MSSQRKTAIVTGASQGIGAGVVKAFVARGFNVVANSRKVSESTEVAASDAVGSRDLGRLAHLPGGGNDVEPMFDKHFHDARADPLRSSGHDGCLSVVVHDCLP